MGRKRRLVDLYRFPAFRPRATVRGVFGDPKARVVRLERRGKKLCVESAVKPRAESTIASCAGCETFRRGHQNLPGDREPSGALPELREGEAGESGNGSPTTPSIPNASPSSWASAVGPRRFRTSPASSTWIGGPSRSSTGSICRNSFEER
jgi:hypothetical protein